MSKHANCPGCDEDSYWHHDCARKVANAKGKQAKLKQIVLDVPKANLYRIAMEWVRKMTGYEKLGRCPNHLDLDSENQSLLIQIAELIQEGTLSLEPGRYEIVPKPGFAGNGFCCPNMFSTVFHVNVVQGDSVEVLLKKCLSAARELVQVPSEGGLHKDASPTDASVDRIVEHYSEYRYNVHIRCRTFASIVTYLVKVLEHNVKDSVLILQAQTSVEGGHTLEVRGLENGAEHVLLCAGDPLHWSFFSKKPQEYPRAGGNDTCWQEAEKEFYARSTEQKQPEQKQPGHKVPPSLPLSPFS